ncbi:hypothetical protein BHE74_00015097 [Ensete ventricosum]|nr:hypothetical protein BHE74_00015097 [Ensete ventricosum]
MDLSPILNALAPSNPTPATVRRARAPGKILHRLPQGFSRVSSSIHLLCSSKSYACDSETSSWLPRGGSPTGRNGPSQSICWATSVRTTCYPASFVVQVASRRIAYREEWPFAIHLLGHICATDLLLGFFCRPNALQTWLDIRFIIQKMVDCEEGVKKPKIITEQNLDPNKLQRLTVSFPF